MPATSKAQRRLMAIAEHNPGALYGRNRGVLSMSQKQLADFAKTKEKGLPKRVKKRGPAARGKGETAPLREAMRAK